MDFMSQLNRLIQYDSTVITETTLYKQFMNKNINNQPSILKIAVPNENPELLELYKTHIEKQLLMKIRKPIEFISSYDNNKKKSLTDIQTKHKYFDVFIETILANKKKIIALDNMKKLTIHITPKFYEDITNLLIVKPPEISKIEKNLKDSIKVINNWNAKFKNNTSMKLNMGVDILNETEERNIEWLKKIFDYLDKNPTKNIAIIVGGAHIFGFDEKNKKTGNTLPNLLSKMNNVKNVNYSTL